MGLGQGNQNGKGGRERVVDLSKRVLHPHDRGRKKNGWQGAGVNNIAF